MAYASLTTNLRNLSVLRAAGWGLMISAVKIRSPRDFRYCLDNGAWTAFVEGRPFDEAAFLRAYERLGSGADFFVVPDIVAAGDRSLDYSLQWLDRLGKPLSRPLLAVQDGMMIERIEPLLVEYQLGIFLGGTTEWKKRTMRQWGELAQRLGVYYHVGRVNTRKRIMLCAAYGADSFDGSSASRYSVNVAKLDNARHQTDLFRLSR